MISFALPSSILLSPGMSPTATQWAHLILQRVEYPKAIFLIKPGNSLHLWDGIVVSMFLP
jgi:hypothetical protein